MDLLKLVVIFFTFNTRCDYVNRSDFDNSTQFSKGSYRL